MITGTYPVITDAPPLPDASDACGRRKFSNGRVDNKGPARLEFCPSTRSAKTTVRRQKGVKSKEFVSSDADLSDPQTRLLSDQGDDSLSLTSESDSIESLYGSPSPSRSRKRKNTDTTSGGVKKKVAFSVTSGSGSESSVGMTKVKSKGKGGTKVVVKGKGKADVKGKGRAKPPSPSPPTIQGEYPIFSISFGILII
jgi:hypothetical protein